MISVVVSGSVASVVITELLSGAVVLSDKATPTVVGAVVVKSSDAFSVPPQAVSEKSIRSTHIKTLNFFIFYSKAKMPYFILSRLNLSVIGLLIKKSRMPVVMPWIRLKLIPER